MNAPVFPFQCSAARLKYGYIVRFRKGKTSRDGTVVDIRPSKLAGATENEKQVTIRLMDDSTIKVVRKRFLVIGHSFADRLIQDVVESVDDNKDGTFAMQFRDESKGTVAPKAGVLGVQHGGSHYKGMKIEVVEFCHANNIPFLEGTIIKHIVRHKLKNKTEDLKKAIHYAQILLKQEYGVESNVEFNEPPESPEE